MARKILQAINVDMIKFKGRKLYDTCFEIIQIFKSGHDESETPSETLGRIFKNITGNTILLHSSKTDKIGENGLAKKC